MTDYNDGNWHGWNGGECPVHRDSVVNVVWADNRNPDKPGEYQAVRIAWGSKIGDAPVAFRVIKQHREPREFWMNQGRLSGTWGVCEASYPGATLFREVLE